MLRHPSSTRKKVDTQQLVKLSAASTLVDEKTFCGPEINETMNIHTQVTFSQYVFSRGRKMIEKSFPEHSLLCKKEAREGASTEMNNSVPETHPACAVCQENYFPSLAAEAATAAVAPELCVISLLFHYSSPLNVRRYSSRARACSLARA
jgi:hypothetical protein